MKYAFVASPYPIIISAEIHCGVPQQDMLAKILREVFRDSLVIARLDHDKSETIQTLPSPDDLKYRVLLKTKNLLLSHSKDDADIMSEESSTSEITSASDSEPVKGASSW